jgi:hypothetical protein
VQHTSINVERKTWMAAPDPDVDFYGDIGTDALITGAVVYGGLVVHAAGATDTYYFARFDFNVGGTMNAYIQKAIAGVVSTPGFTTMPGLTHVANRLYRIRFQIQGTTIRAKFWDPITTPTEPTAWTLSVTDSTNPTAQNLGTMSVRFTGNTNTNPTFLFDNFHVADLSTTGALISIVGTASLTPVLTQAWLKFPLRPFLNRAITLCNWSEETRKARGQLFDVMGQVAPVAVTEVRGGRVFTGIEIAVDSNEAEAVDLVLQFGDIAFLHTPGPTVTCGLARRSYPESCYAWIGDTSIARAVDGRWTHIITLPFNECAMPDPSLTGSTSNWAAIIAGFATWATVQSTFATWLAVNQYIAVPSDSLVG